MVQAAEAQGLDASSVDSIYLNGEAAVLEHEKRNGYDKAYGQNGVQESKGGVAAFPTTRQVFS